MKGIFAVYNNDVRNTVTRFVETSIVEKILEAKQEGDYAIIHLRIKEPHKIKNWTERFKQKGIIHRQAADLLTLSFKNTRK